MKKAKSKNKVIALSAVAVSSVAFAAYTTSGMAQNNKAQDPTALNLNIDKIDKDTVKVSVDNIVEPAKSLQLSLKIEGSAKFVSQDAIKWLVAGSDDIQKDVKISSDGKNIDILVLSNEEIHRDGSKIDLFEIDLEKTSNLLNGEDGYKIVPRENNGMAYSYVVANSNKSKSGTNINNSSDELLTMNTAPTITLKEGTVKGAIIKGNKIEIGEGYDFNSNYKYFVETSDADGDNVEVSIEPKELDTSVGGSHTVKFIATDTLGDKSEISTIVNVSGEKVTEKPTITGVKETHEMYAGEVFDPMDGVSAKDALGNEIEVELSGEFNPAVPGNYELTYTATDKWQNTATATTKITVIKDDAPVITGVEDKTIEKYEDFDPKAGVKVTDDKDKDIESKLVITGEVNNKVAGEYKLSYSVTDSANNTTRAQRIITVKESENTEVPENPDVPDTPEIPPSISDKIDKDIVDVIGGNGQKDNPLKLEVKKVAVKDLKEFLNNLKELNPFVESISKDSEYTTYKIKLENKETSVLSKMFSMFKSSGDSIYIELKVKNTYTDLVATLNEFAKETNGSIDIPENPDSGDNNSGDNNSGDDNSGNTGSTNKPGNTTKPNGENPQTGDSGILPYLGLGVVTSGALFVNMRKRKKK